MSQGFHRQDQEFQLDIGPPWTHRTSGAGFSALAPSGSTSQLLMFVPSATVVATSVIVPGTRISPPGLGSSTGCPGPDPSGTRTGAGGESIADRSAYRQLPSGAGHRLSYAASSAVTRTGWPPSTPTRKTGRRPLSSAVKYTERASGAQATSSGHRSNPASKSRATGPPAACPAGAERSEHQRRVSRAVVTVVLLADCQD